LSSQALQVIITADVSTFAKPDITWSVNDNRVYSSASITLPADNSYDPLAAIASIPTENVTVSADVTGADDSVLTLTCPAGGGMVMVTVTCSATDRALPDVYGTKRTQTVEIFLSGRTRFMDPRFSHDRLKCFLGHLRGLSEALVGLGPYIDKGDPPPPWVQYAAEKSFAVVTTAIESARTETNRLIQLLGTKSSAAQ
jgi:hypothetical protein